VITDPDCDDAVSLSETLHRHCVVCGAANRNGLRLEFTTCPDGSVKTVFDCASAYQGYTGKKLLSVFETNYDRFFNRCREICGEEIAFADGAFRFQILPRAAVLAVLWMGDDEFPPTYKILFEANISYHLPTDGCAILGSMLTGRLIQEPA